MKARVLYLLLSIVVIAQAFGQDASHTPPIIDMHLHVYSVQSYWGGSDYVLKDTILLSPKTNIEHIEAVLEQIEKHNILLTYASGDFESLEMINNLYPGKFLPSYEVWPTKELLGDHEFISKLKMKIKNGEVQGIGESS